MPTKAKLEIRKQATKDREKALNILTALIATGMPDDETRQWFDLIYRARYASDIHALWFALYLKATKAGIKDII